MRAWQEAAPLLRDDVWVHRCMALSQWIGSFKLCTRWDSRGVADGGRLPQARAPSGGCQPGVYFSLRF
jgi:hypothetical protein